MVENKESSFVRANWLQIVLAIVPPLGLWYWLQREHTALTVTITTDTPVVSVDGKYSGDIVVSYKGSTVTALRVVELELRNTGTTPIDERDFDKGSPLSFSFQDSLSTPTVVRAEPDLLQNTGRVSLAETSTPHKLLVEPLLMNPGDSMTVQVFVLGSHGAQGIEVTGHIRGVTDLVPVLASNPRETEVLGFRFDPRNLRWVLIVVYAFSVIPLWLIVRARRDARRVFEQFSRLSQENQALAVRLFELRAEAERIRERVVPGTRRGGEPGSGSEREAES